MLAVPAAACGNAAGLRLQERQGEAQAQQREQQTGRNPAHKLMDCTTSHVTVMLPWPCQVTIATEETLVRYLIVVLALAGMVVSGLALKVHYDTGSEPCRINDKWDCGVVNHSPYSVFHSVPVAAIGIAGYLLIAILGFLRRRTLLLLAALAGLAFALYLTNIEAHVLEVWCLYCVISQAIIAALTLLALIWLGWARFRGANT
jgi:uncharacterized membrane protein